MKIEKKILVCEDEEDVSRLMVRRLQNEGHFVKSASNGIEALKVLEKFQPDLIIMDLNMPEMGGIELYNKLCDEDGCPRFPILIVTGRADLETMFKEFEIVGYITKPFDPKILDEEVSIILHEQELVLKNDGKPVEIVLVNNDPQECQKLSKKLTDAGYNVRTATRGIEALELMFGYPPDLALIQLGLKDIGGDLVILRLMQFRKTRFMHCLLYADKKNVRVDEIMDKFKKKSGVLAFLEYSLPEDLVKGLQIFLQKNPLRWRPHDEDEEEKKDED